MASISESKTVTSETKSDRRSCLKCEGTHTCTRRCLGDCLWEQIESDEICYDLCPECYKKHLYRAMKIQGCPVCKNKNIGDHPRLVRTCCNELTDVVYIKSQCIPCWNKEIRKANEEEDQCSDGEW